MLSGCVAPGFYDENTVTSGHRTYQTFPYHDTIFPVLGSPFISDLEREFITVRVSDSLYTIMDVTSENGDTLDYTRNLRGKGFQLLPDSLDFPFFKENGIHSPGELTNTKQITGITISKITLDGRPGRSSGAGFMAHDETILSVIYADNETIKAMSLKHMDLAKPLFHLWNLGREREKHYDTLKIAHPELNAIFYNGHEIYVRILGSRGWQESIFHDEILGNYHLYASRKATPDEQAFLSKAYTHLSPDEFALMMIKLTEIHTGEMVPFYITRYGFYEGHTEFRADPVTIAFVFNLIPVQQLHKITGGDLYTYFSTHFSKNVY